MEAMMKYAWLVLLFAACTPQPKPEEPVKPGQAAEKAPPPADIVGQKYRERFALENASEKIVSNEGKGPDNLRGTRNMRAVLNGVYYRGGANNSFRVAGRRDNANPLPPEGLKNLCEQGFTESVYLYRTRFETADKDTTCTTVDGKKNTLHYHQVSPRGGSQADVQKLLKMIYRHVKEPDQGPIYDHCWNGWHASGLVAASALQQFCGFTPQQAADYWIKNTDGNSDHPKVIKQVKEFKHIPDLDLTPEEKKALCPDPVTWKFQG